MYYFLLSRVTIFLSIGLVFTYSSAVNLESLFESGGSIRAPGVQPPCVASQCGAIASTALSGFWIGFGKGRAISESAKAQTATPPTTASHGFHSASRKRILQRRQVRRDMSPFISRPSLHRLREPERIRIVPLRAPYSQTRSYKWEHDFGTRGIRLPHYPAEAFTG